MVKARSAPASRFVARASITTENPESARPKPNASPPSIRPEGIGRLRVRRITASMSASHHMLSAPEAPPPTAMKSTAQKPIIGCTATGAARSPTSAVNTTRVMTRGLSSAK